MSDPGHVRFDQAARLLGTRPVSDPGHVRFDQAARLLGTRPVSDPGHVRFDQAARLLGTRPVSDPGRVRFDRRRACSGHVQCLTLDTSGRGVEVASPGARARCSRPRHRRLGPDVRPGQGRGRPLSALRLPRRPVPDRECRPRGAGGGTTALARPPRRARRGRARAPARAGLCAPDGRARADDGVEHRLHHRALCRLHPAARARALPGTSCSSGVVRRRPFRRGARRCSPVSAQAMRSAMRSCWAARSRTRSRSC